jgi:hypothetical protein
MRKMTVCTQYDSNMVCGAVAEIIKAWAALGYFGEWGSSAGL